jgi:DNA-binding beta-propeller fold protein YncE
VTIIDGGTFKVVGTVAAGKRPRGIHSSPDGKSVYVALSGTPIEAQRDGISQSCHSHCE